MELRDLLLEQRRAGEEMRPGQIMPRPLAFPARNTSASIGGGLVHASRVCRTVQTGVPADARETLQESQKGAYKSLRSGQTPAHMAAPPTAPYLLALALLPEMTVS